MEAGITTIGTIDEGRQRENGKAVSVLFCDNNYLALQYDPRFKTGGATKQVVAWVDGLTALGVRAKVLGAHPKPEFFREKKQTIISYDPNEGIPKLRYLYVRIPGLLRALSTMKPDCVYYGVPSPYAGVLAICARLRKLRFILRVSNDFFVDGRASQGFDPMRDFFFRLGFRLADRILCQNDYQFEKAEERYPGKVYKLSNPYSGDIREEPAPFDRRKGIAWVGIFQRQKNLPLLVKLARALPEVPVHIAGGHDKPLSQEDQAALVELHRLPNVSFAGFLTKEEVLALMERVRLLVNTSHYEGFSNTFLEAFSRGTPVVTLPQNDPDQIIRQHGLGEVAANPESLKAKVRARVQDRAGFERDSANCIRYMKTHHDLATQAAQFLKIVSGEI